MRVTTTKRNLDSRLSTEIRRQYPMVYNDRLTQSFDRLTNSNSESWTLSQTPFIEALPQYANAEGGILGMLESLDENAHQFVRFMDNQGGAAGFFSPYVHQAEALESWSKKSDLVVSTGTGSGKTECFLWPIAGHLHSAARRNITERKTGDDYQECPPVNAGSERGMKAIVLYPMNALVTDQLKRLREAFGKESVADALKGESPRRFQFGQYTGRTQFHGSYAKSGTRGGSKNSKLANSKKRFGNFLKIKGQEEDPSDLYLQMMDLGMIPSKGPDVEIADSDKIWHNLENFHETELNENYPLLTQEGDRELVFRHEMHNTGYSNLKDGDGNCILTNTDHFGGTPDILVTNYSMLEYMLKRPLEHGMFEDTKHWLKGKDNHLLLVLDEAHLYQGALGTEVGYLIRRLLASLDIADNPDKVQFILTSASLGDDSESKKNFVSALTGRPENEGWAYGSLDEIKQAVDQGNASFSSSTVFVEGTRWDTNPALEWEEDGNIILPAELQAYVDPIIQRFVESDIEPDDDDGNKFREAWHGAHPNDIAEDTDAVRVRATPLFRALYGSLYSDPVPLDDLGDKLFFDHGDSKEMVEELLNFLASIEAPRPGGGRVLPILGVRAHMIYRGLPTLYWNITDEEISTRAPSRGKVGYHLRGCRRCGGPYLNLWINQDDWPNLAYEETDVELDAISSFQSPMNDSIRLEIYLASEGDENQYYVDLDGGRRVTMDGLPHIWVSSDNFSVKAGPNKPNSGSWRPGYLPTTSFREGANQAPQYVDALPENDNSGQEADIQRVSFSKSTCIQCRTDHSRRLTDQITDYMTRGDSAFSKLISQLLKEQTVDEDNPNPNKGRKTMAFSDSRSRAARLARGMQDDINLDEQRFCIMHLVHQEWFNSLPTRMKSLDNIYTWFVIHLMENGLEPFANIDSNSNPRRRFAKNRIQIISGLLTGISSVEDNIDENVLEVYRRIFATELNSLGEELPPRALAQRNFALFIESIRSREIADANKQDLNVTNRFAYAKTTRDWIQRFLTNGLKRRDSDEVVTRKEKQMIVGVILNPDVWDETSEDSLAINRQELMDRLTGQNGHEPLGIDVDFNDDFLQRLDNIFPRGDIISVNDHLRDHDVTKSINKRQDNPTNRHTTAQRMKEFLRSRMERRKTEVIQNRNYESILYSMMSNPSSIMTLAEKIRCLKSIFLNLDRRNRATVWRIYTMLTNIVPPNEFSSAIMDFIGSKDFSISSLGLGQVVSLWDPVIKKKLENYLEEQEFETEDIEEVVQNWVENGIETGLNEFTHWMTRPSLSQRDREAFAKMPYTGSKCISDESANFFNYYNAKRIGNANFRKSEWGIPLIGVRQRLNEIFDGFDDHELLIDFIVASILRSNGDSEDVDRKILNSECATISVIPKEEMGVCPRCVIAFPENSLQEITSCPACGYDEIENMNDTANEAIFQRIMHPWRNRMDAYLLHEDLKVMIVRAEEHTAQINTTKDDSEMYTSAEEFELLFQDIPYVIPEEDEIWTPPQSPIDVLSCTTTMEVGIDIGSLTTVALRTVPREPANYQQRVGRAGRGKSEVCIALSWCDNQPHAQNMFHDPLRTLSHPSNSPVIYMDNRTIIRRHIHAAVLQSFFKRKEYDRTLRRFPSFTDSNMEKNLMESMGTVGEFFTRDVNHPFSLATMIEWRNGNNPAGDPEETFVDTHTQIVAMVNNEEYVNLVIDELFETLDDLQEDVMAIQEAIA